MIEVTERIYRDQNGKPTLDKAKAQSMLYPEGMLLTEAQAASLPADIASKAVKRPSEDKALKKATENK